MTPFSKRRRAVPLENIAVVEVAVVVEVVVDRGMGESELLQSLYISALRHCTLSPQKRLV